MLHLACHLLPRPLPWWITNPTPYAAHSRDFNLTTTRRSRSIDKFSGEYCEFLFGQQFNHETCCPWPTIFCHPSLWIANPTPPSVPSHNVNKMTNKTDSCQFPFPVQWVWSFFVQQLFETRCPSPAIFCPPPWTPNPMPCTTHSCGINSITKRRSRLIDQSSGEFVKFLFAQLFSWKFLYLTSHLLPLALTMNYNHHSRGPSLFPPASI